MTYNLANPQPTMEQLLTDAFSEDMFKVQQKPVKTCDFNDEPTVTVTIPKSHLDFLNIMFSPATEDQVQAHTVDRENELTSQEYMSVSSSINLSESSPDSTYIPDTNIVYTNLSSSTNMNQCYNSNNIEHMNDAVTSSEMKTPDDNLMATQLENEMNLSENPFSSKNVSKKPRRITKALVFPPCEVCSGKASGLHYGVNTCEACKGFFRRYLLKQYKFKCSNERNCQITNQSRGNCSACRLQKCLSLGMAKEKIKMGRYTLSKRTETIKNMIKMKMYETGDNSNDVTPNDDVQSELVGRLCIKTSSLNQSKGFSTELVQELTEAMLNMNVFGPDIVTDEQVMEELKSYSEQYISIVNLYGEMKPVSTEEFNALYKGYAIDIDGRMKELKEGMEDVEEIVTSYCNFAKHIPGFHKLPYKDQSNLLKTSRAEVFLLLMHKGYHAPLQVYLDFKGKGRHLNQIADKYMSRGMYITMGDVYGSWQKLKLSKEETAVLMALVLMFPDRCKIENQSLVESIQQALAELLMEVLKQTCSKSEASKRFTRMIDLITNMRNYNEMYLNEYKEFCNNEVVVEACPILAEFLLEEDKHEKRSVVNCDDIVDCSIGSNHDC